MGDEMLSHLIKAALVLRGQEKQLQTMKDNILEAETYAEELEQRVASLEAAKWEQQHVDTMNDMVSLGMERDAAMEKVRELEAKLAECEARLGKAVDVDLIEQAISDVLSEGGTYRDAAEYVARATLAELKGDNADE